MYPFTLLFLIQKLSLLALFILLYSTDVLRCFLSDLQLVRGATKIDELCDAFTFGVVDVI